MNRHLTLASVLLIIVLLTGKSTLAQSGPIAGNHSENEPVKERDFAYNPLVLNGSPLDYNFFSIFSTGKLAVVAGEPSSKEAIKIPFRVYLRRNGMIIHKGASDSSRQLYEVDIATVLALAQHGDDLVIDPVLKTDWVARRILSVQSMTWLFPLPGC